MLTVIEMQRQEQKENRNLNKRGKGSKLKRVKSFTLLQPPSLLQCFCRQNLQWFAKAKCGFQTLTLQNSIKKGGLEVEIQQLNSWYNYLTGPSKTRPCDLCLKDEIEMVFSKPLYFMQYIMVQNVLPQFFFVNVVHFNSTIMKDRNGSYDHLNFPHEEIGVHRRSLICQSHMHHKVRIRTKILCLLAHCPIPAPGDFYSSTGSRTPKINEVHESHCLGTKNSGVRHGSLSQIRDETHLFADWLY